MPTSAEERIQEITRCAAAEDSDGGASAPTEPAQPVAVAEELSELEAELRLAHHPKGGAESREVAEAGRAYQARVEERRRYKYKLRNYKLQVSPHGTAGNETKME